MTTMDVPTSETQYPIPFLTSPLFPMLYWSLFAQRHAPLTTTQFRSEYDYIIVGAGSAGSTLASRLSEEPCVSVLLLEAGKSPPKMTDIPALRSFIDSDLDWKHSIEPQKYTGRLLRNRQLVFPLGKVIGGSSTINQMLYVRGHRKRFDDWAANGAIGWSYKELLPYFKKMENNQNFVNSIYHGFVGPVTIEQPSFQSTYKSAIESAIYEKGDDIIDINGPTQKGWYNFQMTRRHGQRCSVAKAYLVPAENRTNLDIVERAMVTKIVIDKHYQTRGVMFDLNGYRHFVRAFKEVIVSAGAIKTPHLLLLSGIGPQEHLQELRIPVISNLPVGLNLQDHIGAAHVYYSDQLPSYSSVLTDDRALVQYIEGRSGRLAKTALVFTAFLTNDRYSSPEAIPDYQLYFMNGGLKPSKLLPNVVPEVYQAIFEPYENKSKLYCLSQNLKSESRGYVKLRSTDPYDDPIIDPNYLSHPKDLKDIVEGLKECDRIAGSVALKRLGVRPIETIYPSCEMYNRISEEYLACEARSIIMTTSHLVGTAKMGDPTDPTTVVDPLLRVKGVYGLRVVDASVMPTIPTANTNAPVIALAEKAADIIKNTFSCRRRIFNPYTLYT